MKRYSLIVLVAMLGLVVAAPAPASTTAIPAKAHIAKKKKKCKKGQKRKKGKCVKKKKSQQPGENHPPAFPDPLDYVWDMHPRYKPNGELGSVEHHIQVLSLATDPDGDRLTYKWTSTLGPIEEVCPEPSDCIIAIWVTPAVLNKPLPGDATLTVSDGRGGSDAVTFAFRPE